MTNQSTNDDIGFLWQMSPEETSEYESFLEMLDIMASKNEREE